MSLLIIFIIMEVLALTGWYFDVTAYGDDVKTSFITNHVVIAIIGTLFFNWIVSIWV